MVKDDTIETSKPMIDLLLPLIKQLHANLNGRHLRILDPFFSNGRVADTGLSILGLTLFMIQT